MEVLEFAKHVRESATSDSDLSMWSARLSEMLAEQTLYAFRLIGKLPVELQNDYWSVLWEALTALPDYTKIPLPSEMLRRLESEVPTKLASQLASRVYSLSDC